MNAVLLQLWQSPHRRQLIASGGILGGCVLLVAGALFWAYSSRAAALMERDAEQAAWSLSSTAAADLQDVASDLPQQEAAALRLLQEGFAKAADRVGWAESMAAALNSLHPIGYTMEIGTAQVLPLPDEMLAAYAERGIAPPAFETNDLSLKIQGLTEDELLLLLKLAAEHGGGVVRTERCSLERRPDQLGLDVDCSLRRYRVRASDTGATP